MRLCKVNDLEEGMVLGKSIFQGNHQLLLGAGYRIASDIIPKLIERGYNHVYIMEPGTDDIIPEDIISDEIRSQAHLKISDQVDKIESALNFQDLTISKTREMLRTGHLKHINLTYDIRKLIEDILKDIASAGAKFLNSLMIKSADTYFVDHAINTTVLSVIIGKKYNFHRQELMSLALGTFLHDIGKLVIERLDNSEGKSSDESLYREHPTFGYLLLKNDKSLNPMETQIVNQHHEYQDGSGFPIGLTGQNLPPTRDIANRTKGAIFRLAEICCVVDAYDNLVLNPKGNKVLTPHEVIKQLLMGSDTVYNRDIVQTLSQVIAVFPVGAYVKIVNIIDPALIGCYGVIARVNEEDFGRPVVVITTNKYKKKIKPIMIDTSKLKTVELKLIV